MDKFDIKVSYLFSDEELKEIIKIKDEYKKLHKNLEKQREESLLMYEKAENAIIEACNEEIQHYINSITNKK